MGGENNLLKRINRIIKSFKPKKFASLIIGVKTKLRNADLGPESLIHYKNINLKWFD